MTDQTTLPPLASQADVESVLGRALTEAEQSRVDAILAKASELFRRRSGQQFTSGTSTNRLRAVVGAVTLTQRPVVSITTVVDEQGLPTPYRLQGSTLLVDTGHRFVTVTYEHGGDVPDLVRLTIAEIAKKVLSIDEKAASGVTQSSTTRGPFSASNTYATWAQGGQTMLAPDDAAIADSYKVVRRFPIIQEG